MKQNSIEEDIKNAEHFIKSIKTDKKYKEENGWHGYYNKEIVELARILEHILSAYKRVLKENEKLKKSKITYEKVRDIQEKNKNIVDNNYIPKQKIKDKIDKLQDDLKYIACGNNDCNKCFSEYRGSNFVYCYAYHQIKVLNELLESEE